MPATWQLEQSSELYEQLRDFDSHLSHFKSSRRRSVIKLKILWRRLGLGVPDPAATTVPK